VGEYDEDALRLGDPCDNCGLPNHRCECQGDGGSCADCGADLDPGDDYFDGVPCDRCQWYAEHGGEA
jgi:hypothetical protein